MDAVFAADPGDSGHVSAHVGAAEVLAGLHALVVARIRGLEFVEADHPNIDYFDGDSPNAQWEGEKNKSTSRKSLMKPW